MNKTEDLIGKKFGRLTVIGREHGERKTLWVCQCSCGNIMKTTGHKLKSSHTRSCGCLAKENNIGKRTTTHGMTNSRIYRLWRGIIARCECPGDVKNYIKYGGRGISVCKEWHKFEPFYEWALENGYRDDLSIERIDNDGDYEPSNCRWATSKEQANNRRNSVIVEYNGESKTLAQWAEEYGILYSTLHSRYKYFGWDFEKAIKTPVRKSHKE